MRLSLTDVKIGLCVLLEKGIPILMDSIQGPLQARTFHMMAESMVSKEIFDEAIEHCLRASKVMPSIPQLLQICKECSKRQKAIKTDDTSPSRNLFCEYSANSIKVLHPGRMECVIQLPEDCEVSASMCFNQRKDFENSLEKSIYYEKNMKSMENSHRFYGMRLCEWHNDVVYAAIYPNSNTAYLVKRVLCYAEQPTNDFGMDYMPEHIPSVKSLKNCIPGHLQT